KEFLDLDKKEKDKGKKGSDPSSKKNPKSDQEHAAQKIVDQVAKTLDDRKTLDEARKLFTQKRHEDVQNGQLGVYFAQQNNDLRFQERLSRSASRNVQHRNVIDVGGIWIDDGFDPKMPTLTVKSQSKAYFRILQKQPKMRDVFQLGNHIVW